MNNRSGTTYSAPTDANRNRVLLGVSSTDGITPLPLEVNGSGQLLTTGSGGGGGGLVNAPLVGQAKIAVTGTAVRLNGGTSQPLTNGIIISAPSSNAASITIGTSGVTNTIDGTGNGYILAAGGSISFALTNTNAAYINGTAGDIISWAGS